MQAPQTGRLAARPALASSSAPDRPGKTAENQTIHKWSIVGNDRLIGRIFHRRGTPDGQSIMTSPVVHVRLMGVEGTPVAFTESGNAYWLGPPAETFGIDRAQNFVWHKSRVTEAPARGPQAPGNETTLIRLMD